MLRPRSFVLFVFVIICEWAVCGNGGCVSPRSFSLCQRHRLCSTCRLLIGRSSSLSLIEGAWFLPSRIKPPGCIDRGPFCEQADDGLLLALQQPHLELF